ncbi:MAG: YeeE/YedE family protein [Anaerolineales bacterium]|nr:YeeE/YedE family protein [Anaerolineales bacterium]
MAPFPLPLEALVGKFWMYAIYLAIGFAFGYVLEISGFAISPKLAAQFYLKDMTVLKVMFTAIIVAMVFIFAASAVGMLDFNMVWVNPTYLWPGIVGGLIMGVGFIIGGFCPGTSLVAVATAKIDGIFFALGVLFGIFAFGETVSNFEVFFNSSYMGRFTLMDWMGLDAGWVALLVVLMALFMFWGGEQLERIFGGIDPKQAPKMRYAGAGALVLVAFGLIVLGQPTNTDRWTKISAEKELQINAREVQIHPAELVEATENDAIKVYMLDVRSEADYNLFHIKDALHTPMEKLPEYVKDYLLEPSNTVFVVMSNDEMAATEAWKFLVAENLPNVYILEGGINNWLSIFGEDDLQMVEAENDTLKYIFSAALGAKYPAATPDIHKYELEFTPKIKLQTKQGPSGGGCGG